MTASAVTFRAATAEDLLSLRLQASQRMFGMEMSPELAAALAAEDAFAAERDGQLLACGGVYRPAPGWHGVGWAMLAKGIGDAHVSITRFARRLIAEHPARRVEAIVRADAAAECRWAEMLGLSFVTDLPGWGPPDCALRAAYARVLPVAGPNLANRGRS